MGLLEQRPARQMQLAGLLIGVDTTAYQPIRLFETPLSSSERSFEAQNLRPRQEITGATFQEGRCLFESLLGSGEFLLEAANISHTSPGPSLQIIHRAMAVELVVQGLG